jgi:hypothetical protein
VSQPTRTARAEGTRPTAGKDVEWRRFPQFEKLFQPDQFEPAVRKMEKTLRQLEDLAKNGPAADRERARTAALAYVRTFALIRQIVDKRNEMAAEGATSGPAAR